MNTKSGPLRGLMIFVTIYATALLLVGGLLWQSIRVEQQRVKRAQIESAQGVLSSTLALASRRFLLLDQYLQLLVEHEALERYLNRPDPVRLSALLQLWQRQLVDAELVQRLSLLDSRGHEMVALQMQPSTGAVAVMQGLRDYSDTPLASLLGTLEEGQLSLLQTQATQGHLAAAALLLRLDRGGRSASYLRAELDMGELIESSLPASIPLAGGIIVADKRASLLLKGQDKLHNGPLAAVYPQLWQFISTHSSGLYEGAEGRFVFRRMPAELLPHTEPLAFAPYLLTDVSDGLIAQLMAERINHAVLTLMALALLIFPVSVMVTRAIQQRRALIRQGRLAQAALDSMSATVVIDQQGIVVDVNPRFTRLLGYPEPAIEGQHFEQFLSLQESAQEIALLKHRLIEGSNWHGEICGQHLSGALCPLLLELHPIPDGNAHPGYFVIGFQDISELKQLQSQLKELALRDPLTACWNRRHLNQELHRSLEALKRHQHPFVLAVLTIDNYRLLKEQMPAMQHDQMLVRLADLLERQLRRTDQLAYCSEGEFVLLLNVTELHIGLSVLERIHQAVAEDTLQQKSISCSIGAAEARAGDTHESVMDAAQKALEAVHASGRSGVFVTRGHQQWEAANAFDSELSASDGR